MDQRKKILIVDDVKWNRIILKDLFVKSYEILEAENGEDALQVLEQEQNSIAIVLLDLVMPIMDGIDVLKAMSSKGMLMKMPVIVITASTEEEISLKIHELGAADVILKPFNFGIVKRRVENVIELYRYRYKLEETVRNQMREIENQDLQIRQSNLFIIDTLCTAVEFRDCESGQHIKRIRDITRMMLEALCDISEEYHFTREQIEVICNAAAMHDIGKIAIPDSVLNKPGPLADEEFEIMKTHSVKGCEILENLEFINSEEYFQYCYDICRYHHERWDGRGYPDHLCESQIPIWAQIVSLADVYDALVSERVYKKACTHEKAMEMIINGECGAFNPLLLERMKEMEEKLKAAYKTTESNEVLRRDSVRKQSHQTPDQLLQMMEKEKTQYQVLPKNNGEIFYIYQVQEDRILFSENFQEMFGQEGKIENVKDNLKKYAFVYKEDTKIVHTMIKICKDGPNKTRGRIRLRLQDGRLEWFEAWASSIWDKEHSTCLQVVGKIVDIHELKEESEHWKQRIFRDRLTNLYNKEAFRDKVIEKLESMHKELSAIFFIDIDEFKWVNDHFGHAYGDEVLKLLAKRIKHCFRESDIVGKGNGDEFLVFMGNVANEEVVEKKLIHIMEVIHNAYRQHEINGKITASIGVALYPLDGEAYDVLIRKADQAVFYAKSNGRNRYDFFKNIKR